MFPIGQGSSSMYVYTLDSKKFRKISDFGTDGRWLSDSKRIIFHNKGKIFILDTGSGKSHELLSPAPGSFFAFPVPSLDNHTIYYEHQVNESNIWRMTMKQK